MDNQNHVTGNEQIENEEQSIGEPKNAVTDDFSVSQEDDERLTLEKRMAEADDIRNDESSAYHGE